MATAPQHVRTTVRRALLLLLTLGLIATLPVWPAAASAPRNAATVRAHQVDTVMTTARSLRGTPYRWGGTTPRGFDCSGYVRFVYAKVGESLPRTSSAQYARSTKITKRKAQRGDLVFFLNAARVYHVGIYAGAHRIWHAPKPGGSVRLERIWTSHWRAGRVL